MKFQKTETVVCSTTTTIKSTGIATTPATSMDIVITDPVGTEVVTSSAMTEDGDGLHHYDYTPASTVLTGEYKVQYKATDGTRITISKDTFEVE